MALLKQQPKTADKYTAQRTEGTVYVKTPKEKNGKTKNGATVAKEKNSFVEDLKGESLTKHHFSPHNMQHGKKNMWM